MKNKIGTWKANIYTKSLYKYKFFKFKLLKWLKVIDEPFSFYLSKNEIQSLEVSVKAGCGLMCTYCPQDKYISNYKSKYPDYSKNLSLEIFETAMNNVSKDTHIWWSAFTEPLDSKYFPIFCKHLINNGYNQSISTTLSGTKKSVKWFLDNMNIFSKITFHLPDNEGLMNCKVDDDYIKNLRLALNGPHGEGWPNKSFMTKSTIFLIGNSLEKKVESVVNEFVREGKFDKSRILKAKILNTRNSTISTQEINLEHISFRSKPDLNNLVKKQEEFYCAYRRLNQGVLLPNGEVSLCCQDFSLEYILGDLKTEKLETLYKKIQKILLRFVFLK